MGNSSKTIVPNIGDIYKGSDIGFNNTDRSSKKKYIWEACPVCNTPRWVVLSNPHGRACLKCTNLKYHKIFTRELLTDLYTRQNLTTPTIALKFGTTNGTVWLWLRRYNIPIKTRQERAAKRIHHRVNITRIYISIFAPNHPYCDKQGYVYEHRLAMESILGRYLRPEEIVHHKNHNTKDNRGDNLILFSCNGEHIKFHRAERRERNARS